MNTVCHYTLPSRQANPFKVGLTKMASVQDTKITQHALGEADIIVL